MATAQPTVRSSVCPLDCPDTCSLTVRVEEGRVTALDGDERNPITRGFLCGKVRDFTKHLYGEARIARPGLRDGPKGEGRFRPVSWDEALDRIAAEVRRVSDEFGGEAILPLYYGGSNGYLSQSSVDARLFRRLGASRLARAVCAAPTSAAFRGLYGQMPGIAFSDYEHARLIVVWGANPAASGIHLVPFIKRAQERGATLIVVDPRRTKLAAAADLHLAVRPGADLPVALAVAHHLFEQGAADLAFLAQHAAEVDEFRRRASAWTLERAAEVAGVAALDLERFARLYAGSSPAVIRCGWGLERNRNGGSAAAAVLALPAVAGKFGVRGGGYTMTNGAGTKLNAEDAIREPEPDTRVVNMNRAGEALLAADPPVKLLFVYNANPLSTLPAQGKVRRGLEREDLFTVVFDQVHTDTARYADVILPATTFLEHAEVRNSYGALSVQRSDAVIDPVGEARPNYEVFAELCRRLGLDRPGDPERPEELADALVAGRADAHRIRTGWEEGGIAFAPYGAAPVQFRDVLPGTADGRIHLVPPEFDAEAPHGLYAFQPDPGTQRHPLALISPASHKTISSTFGQLLTRRAKLGMHPRDAQPRGIRDGDPVRVHNELGEVHCAVAVTEKVRPGVVELAKGLWDRHTINGSTSNALAPDSYADLGEGACFNDARVEVEKLDGSRP